MKPGDTIELHDTRMEVVEADGSMVRLRYLYLSPHVVPPMREWFAVADLLARGWRVIPAVEVPPCRAV